MGINFTLITKDPTGEKDSMVFDIEMMREPLILAINTGSTSTKLAVYRGEAALFTRSIAHSTEELQAFEGIFDQLEWRKGLILEALAEEQVAITKLSAVIARGGLLRPIESGVYEVGEQMIAELRAGVPQHASNICAIIAAEIASMCGVGAYIADPITVDERIKLAKMCGVKQLRCRSIFHALNQKATARLYASEIGTPYEELNLVVAHMGGGVSVAAHRKGLVIDCNNALDGEGPIAPERAGTLPAGELIDLCYSGEYSHSQARELVVGKGGLVSLTGTNSVKELVERAENGDKVADEALELMAYTTIKHIGAMAAALKGEVDAILLTGGIAYCGRITDRISEHCRFIAPVSIYPGENELESLAMNALRVLRGETEVKKYI